MVGPPRSAQPAGNCRHVSRAAAICLDIGQPERVPNLPVGAPSSTNGRVRPAEGRYHVTSGGAVAAAKQVTSVIPIVFALAVDPIRGGLAQVWRDQVATSRVDSGTMLAGKRLELLRRGISQSQPIGDPGQHRLSVAVLEMDEFTQRRKPAQGRQIGNRRAEDIMHAFEALKAQADDFTCERPTRVRESCSHHHVALAARLPTTVTTASTSTLGV